MIIVVGANCLPIPEPEPNETKQDFISRCIESLSNEDPNKPKDQISAQCYTQWAKKGKTAKSLYEEIVERINKIRSVIKTHFGDRGTAILDYTLVRIGAFDPKMQKLNIAALKGDFALPFIKDCPDGSIEIGNLVFADVEFTKVDEETHIVSGYINTASCDVYDDIFLPEAYIDSLNENYVEKKNPIFFMHHTDIPAGTLLSMKKDEVGVYVETKPFDNFWPLFADKTLRGFSVGGGFRIWPDVVGRAWISHKRYALTMPDISYVTRPANMLSYYDGAGKDAEDVARVAAFAQDTDKPQVGKIRPFNLSDNSDQPIESSSIWCLR